MGNFFNSKSFFRVFSFSGNPCIINMGYDDFHFTKPYPIFRTQNFYTWHFVLSGEGTLEINDNIYSVKTGDIFFIPPNIKMRYYPDKDNPWEYVWFALSGKECIEHAKIFGFTDENPVLTVDEFFKIKQILKETIDGLHQKSIDYFALLSAYYKILDIGANKIDNNYALNIKQFIDANFSLPDFSIEKLCKEIGMSHSKVLRVYKKEQKTTVIKYLIEKRISFACKLLENTNLSVKEVALSSGFSDELHFMKTFKKMKGISALNYRKNPEKR